MPSKVSVIVRFYNQEKLVESCLNGILAQEFNGDLEILVGNDNSTDGTRGILDDISLRHKNVIVYHHQSNLGALKNYDFLFSRATGNYVCVCDGDDYFLPGKIDAQVDFLNSNPEYNIVWHAMELNYPSGLKKKQIYSENSFHHRDITIRDVLLYGTIACFSSRMFRRDKVNQLPFEHGKLDNIYDVEALSNGKGFVLTDKILGGYQVGQGIASSGDKIHKLLVLNLIFLKSQYPCYRAEVSAHSLLSVIWCLKKRHAVWRLYLKLFISTLSVRTIPLFFHLILNLDFLKLNGKSI
ncbi:glycosyltransferase family 2 protein [Aeromonas salmonicida]